MKQHFDFLPTKSELATANNNEITPFLDNQVESFSVGRKTIHTRDLKTNSFQSIINLHVKNTNVCVVAPLMDCMKYCCYINIKKFAICDI